MRALLVLLYLAASALPIAWLAVRAGDAWRTVLGDSTWQHAYGLALLRAALAALAAAALAVPAAVAIAGYRFSGRRLAVRVFALARVVPTLLLVAPGSGFVAYLALCPEPYRVPVAHLGCNVPIAVWIMTSALARTPQGVVDLARGDGLGLIGRLRFVLWPRLAPALVLSCAVSFAASWSEIALTEALGMVAEGALHTIPMTAPLPERAVAALLALVPGLVCGVLVAWAASRDRRAAT